MPRPTPEVLQARLKTDLSVLAISTFIGGNAIKAIAAYLIYHGNELGYVMLNWPISAGGIVRTPYVAYRISQESRELLPHLQPWEQKKLIAFYCLLVIANILRLPPGVVFPVGSDVIPLFIISAPQHGKAGLNKAYDYLERFKKSYRPDLIISRACILLILDTLYSLLPDHADV